MQCIFTIALRRNYKKEARKLASFLCGMICFCERKAAQFLLEDRLCKKIARQICRAIFMAKKWEKGAAWM